MTQAKIIVDLGFGDAGKGRITDKLSTPDTLVVRYNGGAQAAHNVIRNGFHHTFSQFGAGTLAGASTYLSEWMMVEPLAFMAEAEHLAVRPLHLSPDPCKNVFIHPQARIITPWHIMANRKKEWSRGGNRHGSCGMGIGEVVNAANHGYELTVGELVDDSWPLLFDKCVRIRRFLADQTPITFWDASLRSILHWDARSPWADFDLEVSDFIRQIAPFRHAAQVQEFTAADAAKYTVLFEGAQGILIDEIFGDAPHTTWSNCTTGNAEKLCVSWDLEPYRLGVTRTYMARHGAGPLPTQFIRDDRVPAWEAFTEMGLHDHNEFSEWQGHIRYGFMDLDLIRYATACNGGIDGLALTWLDAPVEVVTTQSRSQSLPVNPFRPSGITLTCPSSIIALDNISEAANAPIVISTSGPGD